MKKSLVLASVLFIVSCAHHRDVRPGANGIHQVAVSTEDKEEGGREAVRQANHYCDERKQSAAFIDEESKYTGDMDEKDYKKLKTAGRVAKTVGGAAWVLGGKNESNLGGVVGLGGVAADSAAGKGYTVRMSFKCQ